MAQWWSRLLISYWFVPRTRSLIGGQGHQTRLQSLFVEFKCVSHLPGPARQCRLLLQWRVRQRYRRCRKRCLRTIDSLLQAIPPICSPRFPYRRRILRRPLHPDLHRRDPLPQETQHQPQVRLDRKRSH